MYNLLENINKPNDIKNIDKADYRKLAGEIRTCLIKNVSRTGGHLASNLGVVELTMALHLCLDFPKDKLIWDVGHQSYVHKILTGRWRELSTLRQYGGISGFPKLAESESDSFETGHASTSVSAALGYAFASKILNKDEKVFAVIGDGSTSGGLFYEAINNAVSLRSNMVIVLNDNNMSISKNVGGMSKYLTKIRTASQYKNLKSNVETALRKMPYVGEDIIEKIRRSKSSLKHLLIPGMLFEDMGITYIGPIDGHNISEMIEAFGAAMKFNSPVLVHVKTKKGKGYKLAEQNPCFFHGVEPFVIKTGEPRKACKTDCTSYTKVFGDKMCELAQNNDKVVAVCAAMPLGTGLSEYAAKFRSRFFDVGIAEEHAVTFAATLAAGGLTPVVAIYSTFLQRSYDQILHDVCRCGYHVVFALDRSGIVGADGDTHQGAYDISYLSSIPGLTVMAPKNRAEFEAMLEYAVNEFDGPIAVRYPRGEAYEGLPEHAEPIECGKSEIIVNESKLKKGGSRIVIFALGSMVACADEMYPMLKSEGYRVSIVNMRFAKPLDTDIIDKFAEKSDIIVTMEENSVMGGMSENIAAYLQWNGYSDKICIPIALPDAYIEHGSQEILKDKYNLTAAGAVEIIRSKAK